MTLFRLNKFAVSGRIISLFGKVCMFALILTSVARAQDGSSVPSQPYQLSAGDLITISVFQEPDLSFQVRLGELGVISYPFIGDLLVKGETTNEVESTIRERLISGEFLISPEVSVNIAQYRTFYIDGEVGAPGSYSYEPGLTLRKAITLAGSFTERASRSNISIVRDSEEISPSGDILEERVMPDDIITVAERFF